MYAGFFSFDKFSLLFFVFYFFFRLSKNILQTYDVMVAVVVVVKNPFFSLGSTTLSILFRNVFVHFILNEMKKFYCLENGITFCESNSYIHFLMVCVCWKKKFFFFALKINTRQNDGGGTHFYFISGNIFPISIFFGSRFFFLNTLLRIKYLKDLVVAVVEWFRLLHRWKKNVNIPPYKMNLNTEKKFEKNWKIISSLILLAIFFRGLISVLYSQFDNEVFHHYPEFIFISVVHFFFLSMAFYYHFILLSEKWLWRWWF